MTDAHIRRIAPAESGSTGTNWSRYTLDQIWAMVRTEDGLVTYTQIDAWRRMAELCNEQADQLEKAMNQLLHRWPARPGSASAAFSRQVTALVWSMRKSAEAATANQEPLRNITDALTGARIEIGALLETRQQYALTEQQLTPQPTPSLGQIPVPAAPASLQPPPTNWLNHLEHQAHTIMAHTDATVGTEARRIQIPPEYIFQAAGVDIERPPPSGDTDGNGSVGTSSFAWPTFDQAGTAPSRVAVPPLVVGGNTDPVLTGGAIPATPTTDVPIGSGAIGGAGTGGATSGGSTSGSFVTTPYGAVLAPGGTIGARASTPAVQITSRASTNRIPTVPGTQSGTGGRLGTQGAMPMAPMVPPRGSGPGAGASGLTAAGRLGRRGRNRSHSDPDDPWAVAEGGPAVLEPAAEPTDHDPGPGVIGLDR